MKVLITGGLGYVGRNLIRELEAQGHELRLLDRVPPEKATMFDGNSGGRIAEAVQTTWPVVVGEITDPETAKRSVEGVDAVVHLAAVVQGFPDKGYETFHTNACGTFLLIDEARKAGVKRFFVASSINAFGTFYWRVSKRPVVIEKLPLTEDHPVDYEDPYSLSKHVNELTLDAFSRGYGMTTASFRFAGVWSQKMYAEAMASPTGVEPNQERVDMLIQWVHVEDLVRGIRQALEKEDLPKTGVYTMGAGDIVCREPTMTLLERFRPDLIKKLVKPVNGREPLLSIEKARQTFGYSPRFRMGE
jgi:UDP-glucose 4-epimerase